MEISTRQLAPERLLPIPQTKIPPLAPQCSLATRSAVATRELEHLPFLATPLAGKTQQWVIFRSAPILPAATTRPTVLVRSTPTRQATLTRPLVWMHCLAIPPRAKTPESVRSLLKTIPLAVLRVEAEQQSLAQTQPSAPRRSSPTRPAVPTPQLAFDRWALSATAVSPRPRALRLSLIPPAAATMRSGTRRLETTPPGF